MLINEAMLMPLEHILTTDFPNEIKRIALSLCDTLSSAYHTGFLRGVAPPSYNIFYGEKAESLNYDENKEGLTSFFLRARERARQLRADFVICALPLETTDGAFQQMVEVFDWKRGLACKALAPYANGKLGDFEWEFSKELCDALNLPFDR